MRQFARFLIALSGSLAALATAFYLGSLLLLVFDHNYHDGVAAVGGLAIGVIVGAIIFKAIWTKLNTWVRLPH